MGNYIYKYRYLYIDNNRPCAGGSEIDRKQYRIALLVKKGASVRGSKMVETCRMEAHKSEL